MKRVSIRTLALLVELLIAVIVYQCITVPAPPRAGAFWLAGETVCAAPTPSCLRYVSNL